MQPRIIDEISVINAIGRPGPLEAGLLDVYLKCRETGLQPEGMPKEMADILADTHYTFIYQEQVMRLAVVLAGFSLPDADGLRKAIGKKIPEEMAKYKEKFKEGAAQVGVLSDEQAVKLWEDINEYSSYAFNKCLSSNTMIKTVSGDKAISTLDSTDKVYVKTPRGIDMANVVELINSGKQELYRITLDNGLSVDCTLNHKFLCSDEMFHTVQEIIDNSYDILV